MKKIVLTFALLAFAALPAFADMMVAPSALPQNAQNFIKTTFQDANVMYVEQDFDGFEVRLSNGVEIDFRRNGDWEEIKGYQALPVSLLPAAGGAAIQKNFPQAQIVKIEKSWKGYEVKLNNMMEVYLDSKGNIVGQKYDD